MMRSNKCSLSNGTSTMLSSHIHNFQHIRKPGCDIDYVVNTSGSLSRPKVKAVDGTVFCSGEPGFSLVSADKHTLDIYFINKSGKVVYTVEKKK